MNGSVMRFFSLILVIILFGYYSKAQNIPIGTPDVKNYPRTIYNAGSQNWDIVQAENGKMYFANNNGLLEFDGIHWNLYNLPNNSVVRSLFQTTDHRIYAGGFNEFGYFSSGDKGDLEYHSLTHLIAQGNKDFGEVWKIYQHADGLVFQSFEQLMIYHQNEIKLIAAPKQFHLSFMVDDELYVNDLEKGLMRYAMGKVFPLNNIEKLKGKEIWGMLSHNHKLMIATASDGVYLYDGNELQEWNAAASEFLRKNQIFSLLKTKNGTLIFGTIQNGLLFCHPNGNFQNFNMSDGLQNNTILCLEEDYLGNIWIGSDHGIDYLEFNSSLAKISHNYGLSTGYTAYINDEYLYFGTNQGVFFQKKSSYPQIDEIKKLPLIEATRGQVWTLTEIDNHLFCGHNAGAFLIDGAKATKLSDIPGGWIFLQIPGHKDKIIGGTYLGLVLYEKENGTWKMSKQYEGFTESARSMAFDVDGSLWMTHGYKGVYRFRFDKNYDSIVDVDYYPSGSGGLSIDIWGLANIKDKIVFLTGKGVLRYSNQSNGFVKDEFLATLLGDQLIKAIYVDKGGNLWYFTQTETGVLRMGEDGQYTDVRLPFKKLNGQFMHSFEYVYPYDNENVLFAVENGFAYYRSEMNRKYDYSFQCYLNHLRTYYSDSTYLLSSKTQPIILDFSNNDISFEFGANDFSNRGNILFSTYLEGYENNWSDWQPKTSREFTNLYEGDYRFKVRAKNIYGTITAEESVAFKVLPPFRRSIYAWFIYFLIFVMLVIGVIYLMRKRFEKAKEKNEEVQREIFRKKEEKLQREALEAEKELIRMRNEELRKDMKQKDKELANSTMQMIQKSKTLSTIKNELHKLSKDIGDDIITNHINSIIPKVNREIENETQWEVFESHFENVHEEFLKRLKADYPDLTPREMRLCAYLRLNITSKEIASLMNISTRGVEISRYRLRKKLGLEHDSNLTDFIMSF